MRQRHARLIDSRVEILVKIRSVIPIRAFSAGMKEPSSTD